MTDVSRETWQALQSYAALIERWNKSINLVGKRDMPALWERHIRDCLQLAELVPPEGGQVIDLGSGAGLPGIVIALARPDLEVALVESDTRKAAFLQNAVAELGIRAQVYPDRIEALALPPAPVVTARALAPLSQLLRYAAPLVAPEGICLFPKGRNTKAELTLAAAEWQMEVESLPSRTDPDAVILRIRRICRVATER